MTDVKLLSDLEVMGKIKKLMAQLDPADYHCVTCWLADKYPPAQEAPSR